MLSSNPSNLDPSQNGRALKSLIFQFFKDNSKIACIGSTQGHLNPQRSCWTPGASWTTGATRKKRRDRRVGTSWVKSCRRLVLEVIRCKGNEQVMLKLVLNVLLSLSDGVEAGGCIRWGGGRGKIHEERNDELSGLLLNSVQLLLQCESG